jgi:hypothetical protein
MWRTSGGEAYYLSDLINATTLVGAATFLWYRKGRLWNFYDSLVSKSIEQMKRGSINRMAWEKIALEQCSLLSQETFQGLFRFEVDFLRQKVLERQYDFWIPDSETIDSAMETAEIEYSDKEKYCRYAIKELFLSEFRFCGLRLFCHALKRYIKGG